MKKLALVTLLTIITTSLIAQWEIQNPIPTNAPLNDIFFIDNNHGWAVGEYLTILYTEDAGITWTEQLSAADSSWYQYSELNSIYFSDLNNGWAVGYWYMPYGGGYTGLIFRTVNGGATWEEILSFEDYYKFCDVQFISAMQGWVVDERGTIIYTNDGGDNFSVQYNDTTKVLKSMCFVNNQNGWVVGDAGLVLHTSNGGSIWEQQTSADNSDLISVCFTDADTGWATGGSGLFNTSNGGNTWERILNWTTLPIDYTGDVVFTDSDHGWLSYYTREGNESLISYTSDGGITWEVLVPGFIIYSPLKLFFNDQNTGWAIGDNLILSSSNAGLDWQIQNAVSYLDFKSVFFTDQENGWALGEKSDHCGESSSEVIILNTNNGGDTWKIDDGGYKSSGEISLNSLFFIDSDYGWASGNIGGSAILMTTDGGLNWEWIEINYYINPMFFVDRLNGWGGGEGIYHTADGGHNWYQQYDLRQDALINDIHFIDENIGWAVGFYSSDNALILNPTFVVINKIN